MAYRNLGCERRPGKASAIGVRKMGHCNLSTAVTTRENVPFINMDEHSLGSRSQPDHATTVESTGLASLSVRQRVGDGKATGNWGWGRTGNRGRNNHLRGRY